MISYAPLWETLKVKGMSQYRLIKEYGVDCGLLYRLRHDLYTTLYTVERLCRILDCRVEDVVEYIKD